MNFLKYLKKEVKRLKLKSDEEIAYFIYIQTGIFFEYNQIWEYGTAAEAHDAMEKIFDEKNIEEFLAVCKSWAKLYIKLLAAFHIKSEDMSSNVHFKVKVTTKHKTFIADITKKYQDITFIKFGLPIQNFFILDDNNNYLNYCNNKIYNQSLTLQALLFIKKEIAEKNLSEEDYIQTIFNLIKNIFAFPRPYVKFISGQKYVDELLKYFYLTFETTTIYNTKEDTYMKIFIINSEQKTHYLVYKYSKNTINVYEETFDNLKKLLNNNEITDEFVLYRSQQKKALKK